MIAGAELERGIRQAMAREGVAGLSELARQVHIRRDTMYGWFHKPVVAVSPGSIDKLVGRLGSKPGDPWYVEPIERTLDAETRKLLNEAMARMADQLIEVLDRHLSRTEPPAEQ